MTTPTNTWTLLVPAPALAPAAAPAAASSRWVLGTWPAVDVFVTDQPYPVTRGWGGIHYGDGKIFYFGGGHGGYSGNDVEVYDIATNIWAQSYQPEWCAYEDPTCNGIYGGWGVDVLSPTGRPLTEHTFQKLSWNPATGRLMALLTAGTFAYDPVTTLWTLIAPAMRGADIGDWGLLDFDPDLGATLAVIARDGTASSGIYTLSATGWEILSSLPFRSQYVYSTYLPDHHAHLLYGGETDWHLWRFDPRDPGGWTDFGVPVPNLDSLAYDTTNHVLIGIEHPAAGTFNVWSCDDLATNVWTSLPLTGAFPSQHAGGSAAYGPMLRYDPDRNLFIFLEAGIGHQNGPTNTWSYRYA